MSMEPKKTVLIVEDEKNIVDILRFNLRKEGYDTLEAFDGVTGLRLALEESPDLILLDGGKGHVAAVAPVRARSAARTFCASICPARWWWRRTAGLPSTIPRSPSAA